LRRSRRLLPRFALGIINPLSIYDDKIFCS
jgi:hypothetical protein